MSVIIGDNEEMLIQGIIKQAVDDYIEAKKELYRMYDTNTAIICVIKKDWGKYEKIHTLDDAYKELDIKRQRLRERIEEVKRYFHSKEYKSLTDISGDYMLKKADEKFEKWKEEQKKEGNA